jgi:uridine phosphorylase
MYRDYPILEYDPTERAILQPQPAFTPPEPLPARCLLCYFQEVIEGVVTAGRASLAGELSSENGRHPVYVVESHHGRFTLAHPGVGAPFAAAMLEELIALGCTTFITVGSAGTLDKALTVGHAVIPTSAIRDEGTSYHYLPPGREVAPNGDGVAAIRAALEHHHVPYVMGKTWTTDGLYRETPAKIAMRQAEGCLTVEMEAAALFAVAQFRRVRLAQLLYAGDDLTGDEWDSRDFLRGQASTRERLFWLTAEALCAF